MSSPDILTQNGFDAEEAQRAAQSQLRGIKNLSAEKLELCDPWTFVPRVPSEAARSKETFRAWCNSASTDHLFFTATKPMNPGIRPSKLNPAARLHGLIADYDAKITPEMMRGLQERCADGLAPTWISRTFSGGARLVWLFEEPIAMDVPALAERFLAYAKRELRLVKLLPGLDDAAWKNLHQLYEAGSEWQQLSEQRIQASTLNYWLFEAAQKVDAGKLSEQIIPLEIVEEEVHRRFPGRWEGPFEAGRRGVVFFSPGSDNPTAAIVIETGMICFSQERTFYSWRDIFGLGFVKQYEADKIGRAAADVYFCGRHYHRKNASGHWNSFNKDDFALQLRTKHSIEPMRRKGETASEVDRVIAYVQEHRRVDGVAPRIYCPEALFTENGKRYLNTSRVRALAPSETPQEWGANFPWLADFIATCWAEPDQTQRDHFLAWLKRFYVGARHGNLAKGQALFIAGPTGRGKTLLSSILSKVMGGSALAGDLLLANTQFNKEPLETGLWIVDDAVAAQDPKVHQRFSELVKQVVANSSFAYQPKFQDSMKVTWNGRLLIALNDNDVGIRMIPALEPSIEDKLMILRFSSAFREFPERAELEETIDQELPHFLRWLTDLEIPQAIRGESRFGCKSYIHPELRVMAMNSNGLSDVVDLIRLWIKRTKPNHSYGEYWTGTAAELMIQIQNDDGLRPLVNKFTTSTLGRKLTQAAPIYGELISIEPATGHKGDGARYRIRFALDSTGPQGGSPQSPSVHLKFDGDEAEADAA